MMWPTAHEFAGGAMFLSGQLLWRQRQRELPRWYWLPSVTVVLASGLFAWWPVPELSLDLGHGGLLVALLWGLVGSWQLKHDTAARGLLLCGCGLLAWTAGADGLPEQWAAVVGVTNLRLMDRRDRNPLSSRHSGLVADILSLILASVGYVLLFQFPDVTLAGIPSPTLALVVILSGVGWLTRMFPYPQLPRPTGGSPWADVGSHVLPVLLTPVLWMNLLPHILIDERQLAILMPATILPFLLAGLRADARPHTETTLRAIPFVASYAGMAAVILAGWDLLHPDLSLAEARPLLSGRDLLPWILLAESAGWILLAGGLSHSTQPVGTLRRGGGILATLSLAGLPPLPGYWWRLQLLSALVIPHSRAPLLGLYEVTPGNVAFSGLLAAGFLLSMRPTLRLLPREFSVSGKSDPTDDEPSPAPRTAIHKNL